MFRRIRDFLELVKFEHTLFALPFAYLGMVLAAGGWPGWRKAVWITVAMGAARTTAMGLNRLADRFIDAQNPRTASRPLVSGRVRARTAWVGVLVAVLVLVLAAWQLGPLTLKLLPVAMVFLVGYAFTKRFTWLSHFVLGFTDGLAPMCDWIAVRGSIFAHDDLPAWLLLVTVTFWIGGFDLIYACQDAEFDRACGLHAIPARFGLRTALRVSALSHVVTMAALIATGLLLNLGWPYAVGLVVTGGLLTAEHLLVSPTDLSRMNVAFFRINSAISIALFTSVAAALAVSRR
jgi:4-hydroxybenzoate polyprenyltransferase